MKSTLLVPIILGVCGQLLGCSSIRSANDAAAGHDSTPDVAAVDEGPAQDAVTDVSPDLPPDGPRPPAHWEEIANAPQMVGHEVVRLVDGRVLIVGGLAHVNDDTEEVKATWLFDPSSNTFASAGEMNTARHYHRATLLGDGRVLATGGQSPDAYEASTEIFDPTAPAATAWSAGSPMFDSRWGHSAVKLADGRVLVTGGFAYSNSSETAWIFDPQQNNWSQSLMSMNVARRSHNSVLLTNGKVLIAGGLRGKSSDPAYEYLDSLEVYDPGAGTFKLLNVKMSFKRAGPQMVLLDDGRVFIVGGFCNADCGDGPATHDIFDPFLEQVLPISHPGAYPSRNASALLQDGRVLVILGGASPSKATLFDPQKGWTMAPDMLFAQLESMAVSLDDGSVLVVGGFIDVSAYPYVHAESAQRFYP